MEEPVIGTAGTTTCCSPTCGCYDCTQYTGTGYHYGLSRDHDRGTSGGSDYFFYDVYHHEPREPEDLVNLFDERYWDRSRVNRFESKSQVIDRRPRVNRMFFSKRWVARVRNSKPLRRRIRTFERKRDSDV